MVIETASRHIHKIDDQITVVVVGRSRAKQLIPGELQRR